MAGSVLMPILWIGPSLNVRVFACASVHAYVHYLIQLYELGIGPRHLDGYLHYVLLLRHVGTS